jgi:Ser/Thr protein kinase RdoA (MazF antagonist)
LSAEQAARCWFDEAQLATLGEGHIHDTYLADVGGQRFVLQKVNREVFTQPELVMAQTQRVLQQWGQQSHYAAPELYANKDGDHGAWIAGEYWRVWHYLEHTLVVDPIENLDQAQRAARAFASLQTGLAAMPGPLFEDVIEGFLQLHHYLAAYDGLSERAPDRLHRMVENHRGLAQVLSARNAYIHGDCKINNLLFDENRQQVKAIIDFDTVMYGHWAWDLGDLVRSVCYSRGGADVDYFAACVAGFAGIQPQINVADCVAAPSYVTLMLAVRFLTDHLSGDCYFRVAYDGENLHRAEAQFELFAEFQARQRQLEAAAKQALGHV